MQKPKKKKQVQIKRSSAKGANELSDVELRRVCEEASVERDHRAAVEVESVRVAAARVRVDVGATSTSARLTHHLHSNVRFP